MIVIDIPVFILSEEDLPILPRQRRTFQSSAWSKTHVLTDHSLIDHPVLGSGVFFSTILAQRNLLRPIQMQLSFLCFDKEQ